MFGIISLAFHMPQDQETIMNFVVANVLPKMGTASAPNLVEKWITNPNISDFLLVQFVALFIKVISLSLFNFILDHNFIIYHFIVFHKYKSTITFYSFFFFFTGRKQ
jgi:hypothetical protein